MPELVTPDGRPVEAGPAAAVTAAPADPAEVNREFSRAMATDDPSGPQAPPRRTSSPSDSDSQKRRRGRPAKDEHSRTESEPKPSQKSDKDYTEQVAGLTTMGWAALAATPYTSAYATVIEANEQSLVAAGNAACQNNQQIRETVERWSAGGGGVWVLQLAAVGTNMAVQTLQILKDPELRAASRKHTEGKFREFLKAQGVVLPGEEPEQAAADVPAPA